MEEIRPISISRINKGIDKIVQVCYNNVRCIVCGKLFNTKLMKPKDQIFVCTKCSHELDQSEVEIKYNDGIGEE